MNRKIKALGLALVAALALTAVMASVASAQFTSDKEHTILSGEQKKGTNDVFTAGSGFGGITCETATFSGTSTGTSAETQVITPNYSNCEDTFERVVDLDNSSLTYTFTSGAGKGTVHVTGSMTLTVTSGGTVVCTVEIKAQNGNNGISYTNLGGTKGVETTTHSTNVKSTTSGGFFNCGVSNGEHTNGTYDGTSVIVGTGTDGKVAAISVD
jgi:uncharacterized membrane protein